MAYPGIHAATRPDHPAVVMVGSGETLTYRQLDQRSNQVAHLLRSMGLGPGDHMALFMENQIRFMEVVWGALRSGVYVTAINSFLSSEEVAYIIDDCDARLVVTSRAKAEVATAVDPATTPDVERWLMTDGVPAADDSSGSAGPGWEPYEDAIASFPDTPIPDEQPGFPMLYSSGTTGRPKGVKRPLPEHTIDELEPRVATFFVERYRYGPDMVYLSPAPLYHAAPMTFSTAVTRVGGTLLVMERFDAESCLQAIEDHRVTHSQFVPTMFIRMLKLDDDRRLGPDLSSLEVAIHAAAPCPV
ncbi:MAG: AMP-binding protein, partial [Actinomycetota bacterium]